MPPRAGSASPRPTSPIPPAWTRPRRAPRRTSSASSAQGCYLFAAQQDIGGSDVTVVGAVLGQPGGALGPNTSAVDAGDTLVKSIFGALHSFTLFTPGQQVGRITAAWGSTAP